jgi:hypothetical protein
MKTRNETFQAKHKILIVKSEVRFKQLIRDLQSMVRSQSTLQRQL